MSNEVSYLTLFNVNYVNFDLCKNDGAIQVRWAVGVLIRLWVGKKQNSYRPTHLAGATDGYFVDL